MSFNLTAVQIERRVKCFSPIDCINYLRLRQDVATKMTRYWQNQMQIPPGLQAGEYVSQMDFFIINRGKNPFFPPFTSGIRPGFVEFVSSLTDCQRLELFYCTIPRVVVPNSVDLFEKGYYFSDKIATFVGNLPISKDEMKILEVTPPKFEVLEMIQEWFCYLKHTGASCEELFSWIRQGVKNVRSPPKINSKFPNASIFKSFLESANGHTLLCFENYKPDYKISSIINADLQRGYHFNSLVNDFVLLHGYEDWMKSYLSTRIYDVPQINMNYLLELDETATVELYVWSEEETLFTELYGMYYPVSATVLREPAMIQASMITDLPPIIINPVQESPDGLHPTGMIIPDLKIEPIEGLQEPRRYTFSSGGGPRFLDVNYATQAQVDFFEKKICTPLVVTLVKDIHGHYRPPLNFGTIFATETDEYPIAPSYHDGVWMFQHPLRNNLSDRNKAVCPNCLPRVKGLTYSFAFCRHRYKNGAGVSLRYSPGYFLGANNTYHRDHLCFAFKSSSIKAMLLAKPGFVFLPGARPFSTFNIYPSTLLGHLPFVARNEEYTVPFIQNDHRYDMYPLGYPLGAWDTRGLPHIDNHGIPQAFSILPILSRNEYFFFKWDWDLDSWLVRFGYGTMCILPLPGSVRHDLVSRLGVDVGTYVLQLLFFFYVTKIVHVFNVGTRPMSDSEYSSEEGD